MKISSVTAMTVGMAGIGFLGAAHSLELPDELNFYAGGHFNPYGNAVDIVWTSTSNHKLVDGPEFIYSDTANRLTVDFTGTQIIVEHTVADGWDASGWQLFYAWDAPGAYPGVERADYSLVSSTFPGGAPSSSYPYPFIGVPPTWAGFDPPGEATYQAVWDVDLVVTLPEPGSAGLLIAGLAIGSLLVRRRRSGDAVSQSVDYGARP